MQFIVLGLLSALLQEKVHLVEDALSVEKKLFHHHYVDNWGAVITLANPIRMYSYFF